MGSPEAKSSASSPAFIASAGASPLRRSVTHKERQMSHESALETSLQWRVSSRCNNGDCIEVAALSPDTICVRDTKNPGGPILEFTAAEWTAFIENIQQTS
jgi:hypothetical protein